MDLNVHAFRLVQKVTEEHGAAAKNGRLEASRRGGKIGGKSRAQAMTPEKRKEVARKASAARWAKRGDTSAKA
jgi:hypothetical protein